MKPDYLWRMTLPIVQGAALCLLYGANDSALLWHPAQTGGDRRVMWAEATAFHNGWLHAQAKPIQRLEALLDEATT